MVVQLCTPRVNMYVKRLDILNLSVYGVTECCVTEWYLGEHLKFTIFCIYKPDTLPNTDVDIFF